MSDIVVSDVISQTESAIKTDVDLIAGLTQPSKQTDVVPSDATDLTGLATKGLWVGTGGNLSVKMSADAAAHTLKNVPSGTYIPGNYVRVMVATTAADIVAMS